MTSRRNYLSMINGMADLPAIPHLSDEGDERLWRYSRLFLYLQIEGGVCFASFSLVVRRGEVTIRWQLPCAERAWPTLSRHRMSNFHSCPVRRYLTPTSGAALHNRPRIYRTYTRRPPPRRSSEARSRYIGAQDRCSAGRTHFQMGLMSPLILAQRPGPNKTRVLFVDWTGQ